MHDVLQYVLFKGKHNVKKSVMKALERSPNL